jgi:hypothetical protein
MNMNVRSVMLMLKPIFPLIICLVFCSNPGPLVNGRIYVVLNDERLSSQPIRSEFRSYIPTVSHGRTIEFQCQPGRIDGHCQSK